MGFALLLLLLCELCVVRAFQGQPQVLPPPRLFLEPTFPVQLAHNATYICLGAHHSDYYLLVREDPGQEAWVMQRVKPMWGGRLGSFFLERVTEDLAGLYSCIYTFSDYYSENSEKKPLIIRGIEESPFLWVSPTSTPFIRQSLTFHCNSSFKFDKYYFYHGAIQDARPFLKPQTTSKHEAIFYYREVHRPMLGEYVCVAYNSRRPYIWSGLSNVVRITTGASPLPWAPWPHLIYGALTVASLAERLA